jgi:hypothetical protein
MWSRRPYLNVPHSTKRMTRRSVFSDLLPRFGTRDSWPRAGDGPIHVSRELSVEKTHGVGPGNAPTCNL